MRSTLFTIPYTLYGVPLFGFGAMLALWVTFVAVLLWIARKDSRAWSETVAQAPFFAMTAAVIVALPSFFTEGLPIRGYGVMLLTAAVTGLAMAVYRARGAGIDADTIFSLAFWMFIAGIGGARLFFVIEHWQSDFANLTLGRALLRAVMFTEGGLVVYGAAMGAAAAFVAFCLRKGLRVLNVADIIAPSLVAGLALGRLGCLLHGCCFGGPCDLPWAVTFPAGSPAFSDQLIRGELTGLRLEGVDGQTRVVRVDAGSPAAAQGIKLGDVVTRVNGKAASDIEIVANAILEAYEDEQAVTLDFVDRRIVFPPTPHRARSLPIHPTQVYSSIGAALLAMFVWFVYRLRPREGTVIGLTFTLYAIGRFVLEAIRVDETSFMGTGFSISQCVSIVLLLAMVPFWGWVLSRPRRSYQ